MIMKNKNITALGAINLDKHYKETTGKNKIIVLSCVFVHIGCSELHQPELLKKHNSSYDLTESYENKKCNFGNTLD